MADEPVLNDAPTDTPPIPDIKPGYKATEVWGAFFGMLMSSLVAFGVVHASDANNIMAALPAAVAGIGAIAAIATTAWKLMHTRTDMKLTAMKMADPVAASTIAKK